MGGGHFRTVRILTLRLAETRSLALKRHAHKEGVHKIGRAWRNKLEKEYSAFLWPGRALW